MIQFLLLYLCVNVVIYFTTLDFINLIHYSDTTFTLNIYLLKKQGEKQLPFSIFLLFFSQSIVANSFRSYGPQHVRLP